MTSTQFRIEDLFAERAREAVPPLYGAAGQRTTPMISLAYGLADPALFPRDELTAAAAGILGDSAAAAESLNYGMAFPGLTEQVCERLRRQGVEAEPEQLLVGYGSSQILALLPQVFLDPGDTVLIEGPSFMGAVKRFQMAGADLVTVPVDAEGMNTDVLAATLRDLAAVGKRPKFIYTIPTFHNPTGATMPLARRKRLLEIAAEYGVLVVEDDAYGDLRFQGEEVPPLAALDSEGLVLRVSTFSKILAPGLRIGWAYGRREIIDRLAMFKSEGTTGPFITRVVAQYSADGRLDKHITALRDLYRTKCRVMVDAMRRELPDVEFTAPDGGFFVWATLPEGMRATELLARAEEQGMSFLPGVNCYPDERGNDSIRLAFSFQSAERIAEAVGILGKAMRSL